MPTVIADWAAEMPEDRVIDGRDKHVVPGLENGHMHSSEALFKKQYDGKLTGVDERSPVAELRESGARPPFRGRNATVRAA
jgi:cytosine/adenosine deaminase-related metal-dependent hydrolase